MGNKAWHAGPVHVQEVLRQTLLDMERAMLHWLMCPTCDPDDQSEVMLMVVGWSIPDYILAVMTRD